jgi:penicillin amidase
VRGRLAAAAGVVAGGILLAALVGAGALVLGPLPSRRGTVGIPRLRAPVDVLFDRQGVPHVRAVLESDAWRALGFVHAADRMFQMELRRRAARGRLAEIVGPVALPMDREARRNGYSTLAQRDWDALGTYERDALEAYADGVNAFIAEQALPLEFLALSVSPEPWTPVDSLAFGRLLQDQLSGADAVERGAFDDARSRGLSAAVALLDASVPGSSRVAEEIANVLAGVTPAAAPAPPPSEPAPAGSNAWALSGTRTASGKPLLAGDPHLAPERPGVWYAAHVTSADGIDVVGLTLPGLPGVVMGHNGRVAWSLTMHQADDSDLFLERVDWAKGTYQRGDAWIPLARKTETIHVKGGTDVVMDVDRTVHGPIVLKVDDARGIALARAFAPDGLAQGPRAFLDAARAHNGAELVSAWSHFAGPSVNVCWADVSGAIGVHVEGAIPRRRAGDGRFPVPGWTTTYDWDGTFPAASLPAIEAPKEGLVVTANDDWTASGRSLPYPGLYANSDRAARARQLAASLDRATVADMRAMQNDVYSPYAARVVSALRKMKFSDARAVAAMNVLSAWDAKAALHGPSRLFFAFTKEMRKEEGPLGLPATWFMLERQIESGGSGIESALARAMSAVTEGEGPDPEHWSWGHAHRLFYDHPFAGALPRWLAARLRFGPVPLPGEWHTLDVAGFRLRSDGYGVIEIPSARFIVDLSSPDASRLVLPLGQSGQLFDRHAHDQLQAWSTGHDFPLPYTAKAVDAAAISTLRLIRAD